MKLGHTHALEAQSASSLNTPPKKVPIWYLGTFVFVAGSLLNFVSFGFAAQSLLAALGSAQFISNVFFGKVVLGEEVTRSTLLATFIIILGNAIVVNFSSHTSVVYTADDLISFYDGDFNGYAGCMIVLAIASRFIYKRIDDRVKVGELVAHSNLYLPLLYATFSAIIGTQSVVQAKCLSILLRASLEGDTQLTNWFTYFVLIMWLASTSFWLTRMNTALSMFDGLFIIPVLQVFWTFFSILSGGIYFEEFNSFTPGQMLGFTLGVVVVFVGVYMLAPSPKERDIESASKEMDERETVKLHSPSSATPPQLSSNRARGFSWEDDGVKTKTRMVSVWGTTTDPVLLGIMEKDPIRKFEGTIDEQGKRLTTAFRERGRSKSNTEEIMAGNRL